MTFLVLLGHMVSSKKTKLTVYRLALPPALQYTHDSTQTIVHEPLEIDPNGLTYEEQPVKIADHRVKQLRNKIIPLVKVLWTHHGITKVTWETKEEMRNRLPYLFQRYVHCKF